MASEPDTANRSVLLGHDDEPVHDGGRAHVLTIAPNLAPKTAACIAPTVAAYDGQVVVLDIDGQAYAATADARLAKGDTVVRLDPFGVLGAETDSLDPFDLLAADVFSVVQSPELETVCQDIARLVVGRDVLGSPVDADVFGLLCGVIGYLSVVPDKRTFASLYNDLHSDDVPYGLAVVLDTMGKKIPKMSYAEIAAWLQREDGPRTRILQGAVSHLREMGIPQVGRALAQSTVSLYSLRSGAPATVYIVMPPQRLATSGPLLRLWVGSLLHNALRPRASSIPPTLFVLDACAALGGFPLLRSLLGTRPSAGHRLWTFWHDVHQLRTTYPANWPEVVSGAGAVQVLPTQDAAAAAEAEALIGAAPGEVSALGAGEQLLASGGASRRLRLPHG